jgi:hypothetical protein
LETNYNGAKLRSKRLPPSVLGREICKKHGLFDFLPFFRALQLKGALQAVFMLITQIACASTKSDWISDDSVDLPFSL